MIGAVPSQIKTTTRKILASKFTRVRFWIALFFAILSLAILLGEVILPLPLVQKQDANDQVNLSLQYTSSRHSYETVSDQGNCNTFGYFSEDLAWNWQTSRSPYFCLNGTDRLFYFIGNSITRGEYFSMACEMHKRRNTESDACLFSGSSRKLRERQMHLCPKNKFRSSEWKPRLRKEKKRSKIRVNKIDSKLENAFSCYFEHSGIVLAYRWVDSLEEYLNGLKIARYFKPDAIFIQIALQTAEEILKPATRAKFFDEMESIIRSNGLSGDHIYMRSIDPVVSGENKNFAYLNTKILNWSRKLNGTYVDSWSMLYQKRLNLYADEVHPDTLATKAKLDCLLWTFCSKH